MTNVFAKPARRLLSMILSALMAAALASCGRDSPQRARPEPSFPSRADFKAAKIRPVAPSDRPEAQGTAEAEAPRVISLVNDFYATAFLDKKKWSDGTHPGLAGFFTQEAGAQIGPNLGALALADLAPRLAGLHPTKQEAPLLSFFVDDDLSVPFGVVTTVFEAQAAPVSGTTPVAIVHNANFWVTKQGDAYKIYAYTSELKADSQIKSAASEKPPGGTSR